MQSAKSKHQARLDLIPDSPGVYLMKDASGRVIYVGKAKALKKRLRSYFSPSATGDRKFMALIDQITDFDYIVVASELEALLLEANLIKQHEPKFNVLLRDDKNYPYICVTMNETYPRIFRAFRIGADSKDGARYFGPYLSGDLFRALETIRAIFPLKSCRRVLPRDIGKARPCLNYHIHRCIGPCSGDVSQTAYREVMGKLCLFFEGKYDGIIKDIQEQMRQAAKKKDYEAAAVYRDRLLSLQKLIEKQTIHLSGHKDLDVIGLFRMAGECCVRKLQVRSSRMIGSATYFLPDDKATDEQVIEAFVLQHYNDQQNMTPYIYVPAYPEDSAGITAYLAHVAGRKINVSVPKRGDGATLLSLASRNAKEAMTRRVGRIGSSEQVIEEAWEQLAKRVGKQGRLFRIEAYDISNLGDDDRVGGMVVFFMGKPKRSDYRRFKMRRGERQDDYLAMREILERRLARHDDAAFGSLPDLILIDGGKAHAMLAQDVILANGLQDRIAVAGMVKDRRHRTRGLVVPPEPTEELLENAKSDHASLLLLRLLTAIQNEAHRYALTYQKKVGQKRHLSYKLETIEGVGPAKRRALLKHFGRISHIAKADKDQLREVKGLSEKNVDAIHRYFHQERNGPVT